MRPRGHVDKLYYRIGEVAGLVGVEPHVLRYWETEFRSIRPQKSASGQRVYSRRDVDTLLKVKELLYGQGFTIAGAKKKLREGGVEPPPPEVAVTRCARRATPGTPRRPRGSRRAGPGARAASAR